MEYPRVETQEDNSYTETFPQGIAAERAMIPHDEHLTYFIVVMYTETVTARDPAGPPSPDGPAAHIAHAISFHSPIYTQLLSKMEGNVLVRPERGNGALPASDGRPILGPAVSPHRQTGHRHTLPHFFF